jgi:hypothetical protein
VKARGDPTIFVFIPTCWEKGLKGSRVQRFQGSGFKEVRLSINPERGTVNLLFLNREFRLDEKRIKLDRTKNTI